MMEGYHVMNTNFFAFVYLLLLWAVLSFAFGFLRRFLPGEKVDAVKDLTLTADEHGAVFDVPAEDSDTFLTGQENAANVSLEVLKALPTLLEREQSRGRFGGGCGGGSSRFSGGRAGGRSGGGFSNERNGRFSSNSRGGRGRGNNGRKRW